MVFHRKCVCAWMHVLCVCVTFHGTYTCIYTYLWTLASYSYSLDFGFYMELGFTWIGVFMECIYDLF